MAGLFNKLKKGLDSLMAPADDPRLTYAQTYDRQRDLLGKVQRALADIGATKIRLEKNTLEVQAKLPHLEQQARQALINGREDLARLALRRHRLVAGELERLQSQLTEIELEEQRLWLTEHKLSSEIEAFYARQEFIEARYSAAEAQVRIGEALGGISEDLSELGRAMEQAERKSEYMEARAAAIDRLVEDNILDIPAVTFSTRDEFETLDDQVEAHLESLRQELV
jgi:phage shock protein A